MSLAAVLLPPLACCLCCGPPRLHCGPHTFSPIPPAPRSHHAEDVLAALMLGFSLALYSYRQAFASPLSTTAGRLLDAGRAEEARVQGEVMASILAEEAALQ